MNVISKSIISILFSSAIMSASHSATLYTITDLGAVSLNFSEYDEQNLKIRINNNGLVVGWERASSTNFMGFIWDSRNGKKNPLPSLPSYKLTDVNDNAQYVSHIYDSTGNSLTNIWNSDFSVSDEVVGQSNTSSGINANGQISGSRTDVNNINQAFFADDGSTTTDITSTTKASSASAISDSGFVTGQTFINNSAHAFIWDTSSITTLNNIDADVTFSWGSDINNSNQVVGGYKSGMPVDNVFGTSYQNAAYVWDLTTGFTPLIISTDSITWATAINDNGLIVGGGLLNNKPGGIENRRQAILWDNGTAYELGALVTELGDWKLRDATDINNAGLVVGLGQINSAYHAFLLTPQGVTVNSADLILNAVIIDAPIAKQKSDQIRGININNGQGLGFKILNLGPDSATDIKIALDSSLVAKIDSVVSTKGSCVVNATDSTVECSIDRLIKDESLIFAFVLSDEKDQEYDISGSVSAAELDPTDAQNTFFEKVYINGDAVTVVTQPIRQQPGTETTTPPVETSDTTQTDNTTNNGTGTTEPSTIAKKSGGSSSGFGCSLGGSNAFDPMFFILLTLALVGIGRNKRIF